MPEPYQYPCGAVDDGPADEAWKCEIVCTLVGCKACEHFNGTEYYTANTKKGVSMWARHELAEMERKK